MTRRVAANVLTVFALALASACRTETQEEVSETEQALEACVDGSGDCTPGKLSTGSSGWYGTGSYGTGSYGTGSYGSGAAPPTAGSGGFYTGDGGFYAGTGGFADDGGGGDDSTGAGGSSTSGCVVSSVRDAVYWPVPATDGEAEAEELDADAHGGFELRVIDESAMVVEPGTWYVAHRIPLEGSWATRPLGDITAAVSNPELTPVEPAYTFSPNIYTPGSIGARIEECDGERTLVVRVARAGYYPVKIVSGSDVKYFVVSTPLGIANGGDDCPKPGMRTKSARFEFFVYRDENVYASLDGTPNNGTNDRLFKQGAVERYSPDRRPDSEAKMNTELDAMLNVNETFILHAIGHGWKGVTRPWGGGGGYSGNSAEVQNLLKVPNIARKLKHIYFTSCCSGGGAETENDHFTRNIAAGLATKYHVPHVITMDRQVMMLPSVLDPTSDIAVALTNKQTRFVDTYAKMNAAGAVQTQVKTYGSVVDTWDRPIGWGELDGPGQRVTFKTLDAQPRYIEVQDGGEQPGKLRTFAFAPGDSAQFRMYSPDPKRQVRSGDMIEVDSYFGVGVFAKAGEQVVSGYGNLLGSRYFDIYKVREATPGVFQIVPGADTLQDQDLVALKGNGRYLSAARPGINPVNATGTAINPLVVFRIGFANDGLPAGKKISLKTTAGYFFRAEEGGGPGTKMRVDDKTVHELTLIDIDGGDLKHGDSVRLRTSMEYYASCKGGGDVLTGAAVASTWEVFKVQKVSGSDTTDVIKAGDVIGFKTHDGAFYVTGQQAGNRDVVAAATALKDWEKFTIDFLP